MTTTSAVSNRASFARYASQVKLDQEAEDQVALDQEALDHEADDHDALDQEALDHEADDHEADDQEALDCAALDQLAESNTRPPLPSLTTNWSRPAFGFGGSVTPAAPAAETIPTPRSKDGESAYGCAVTISAPLTWSGVQLGCIASRSAAAPATTGA